MKNKMRRCTAFILSMIFCATVLTSPASISAAGEQAKVYVNAYPYMGGENQHPADKNQKNWGHPALNFKNGWNTKVKNHINLRAMNDFNGQICYCLELGVSQNSGDELTSHDENYWDKFPANDVLTSKEIKKMIGRIFEYGYMGNISRYWVSQNSSDADKLAFAYATQLLIWEVIVGERDTEFNHVDAGSYDSILDLVDEKHPLADGITAHYNAIVNSLKSHMAIPSFLRTIMDNLVPRVNLRWNGSVYTSTLTDDNNVLSEFEFSSNDSNLVFEKNGNKLTIKTAVIPKENTVVTATRNGFRYGLLTWSDGVIGQNGNIQDVVTYAARVPDPVLGYIKVSATPAAGTVRIIKTSDDGNVSGISFRITGKGINRIVKSGADGTISVPGLAPGTYTIMEIVPDGYKPQPTQTVEVKSNWITEVRFHNVPLKGNLVIYKTSENGIVSGIKFHVTGPNGYDNTVVTDALGRVVLTDLVPGTYTITEIVPPGYIPQPPKTVEVEPEI